MRGAPGKVTLVLVVLGVTTGLAASARAQVCGDADGNGSVTVTDGVLALRTAAQLSSNCTTAACDVDGNGSITVTDGVLILRKAAELPITENCSASTSGGVEETVGLVSPFLVFGTELIPAVPALPVAAPAGSEGTDDCPAGGNRTKEQEDLSIIVTLDACQYSNPTLGKFRFDGTIRADLSLSGAQVIFDFTTTEVDSGRTVQFAGTLSGAPRASGGVVVDGGPIVLTTPQGDFTLFFDDLTVDGDGKLVSGSARIEDTDDNFDVASASIAVVSSTTADVVATYDDMTTRDFTLNLQTGDLTENS